MRTCYFASEVELYQTYYTPFWTVEIKFHSDNNNLVTYQLN
jgi:hypothetical protein